jgi:hypothetical protein
LIKQRIIKSTLKSSRIETNENAITEEYFRMWLEVPFSNSMQRLVKNPLLSVEDNVKINGYVVELQYSQIRSAVALTTAGVGFYWVFLSRKSFFQKMFNNRERMRGMNILRKVGGVYLLLICSVLCLNSSYEKKISDGINTMGLFKKYRISYQEKYV